MSGFARQVTYMDMDVPLTHDDERKLLLARMHLSWAAPIIFPDDQIGMEK